MNSGLCECRTTIFYWRLFVKVGVDDFRLKMGLKEPEIDFLELN